MADNDEICRLKAENGNMKQLLCELPPGMETRVAQFQTMWPGREILIALHHNEKHVRKIKEFIANFECPKRR